MKTCRSTNVFARVAMAMALTLWMGCEDRAADRRPLERSLNPLPPHAEPPQTLVVEVTSKDYGWIYRLAGADGRLRTRDDRIVKSELHLPTNTVVELLVTSEDYVCTFDVPGLKVRKVAVPELEFPVTLLTGPDGEHPVSADPMCGMRYLVEGEAGLIVVESRAEFESWLSRLDNR